MRKISSAIKRINNPAKIRVVIFSDTFFSQKVETRESSFNSLKIIPPIDGQKQ